MNSVYSGDRYCGVCVWLLSTNIISMYQLPMESEMPDDKRLTRSKGMIVVETKAQ